MKVIESVNNEYIKYLSKLKIKKIRDKERKFLVEGYHLVSEAKNYLLEVLIVDEKDAVSNVNNILVTKEIIKKLSNTDTPQGIIGVCKYFDNFEIDYSGKILLLDSLQDPGNIGTLIRSSLGFDVGLVVLSNDCCDIYNDKLIRSSQGAIFKTKVIHRDLNDFIGKAKENNMKVFGTSLTNGTPLMSIKKTDNFCLILGNEGNGVSKDLLLKTDNNIFIEMSENLESLNVGIAGAIIMHYFYC